MLDIDQSEWNDIIGSFLFLIVGILFLYQTRRKFRNTPTLTAGFFVAFFGQFFNSVTVILLKNGEITLRESYFPQVIFITALNLILVFFWIFLENTYSTRINTFFLVLVTIIGTIYLSVFTLGYFLDNTPDGGVVIAEGLAIGNLFFPILLNIVALRCLYIQYQIFKATGGELPAQLQLYAFLLFELWAALGLVTSSAGLVDFYNPTFKLKEKFLTIWYFGDVSLQELLNTTGDVFYYLGLVLFIIVFIKNPDYIYRLPVNIQDIIVISGIGTAVYGIGRNAQEKSLDEQLLAGFIYAANNFVNEMIPEYPNEVLHTLDSTGRLLRLEFGAQLGICIVSKKENTYLRKSVRKFVQFLEAKDPEDMIMGGEFYSDEEMRGWLKVFFPYLEIDDMESY
ncbi:MAG: hypothetical protein ACXAB7_13130 [Candidatus Kariarchaeaceae archaeon]|jgi:hypothetical protein